jgi:hypothetical protein
MITYNSPHFFKLMYANLPTVKAIYYMILRVLRGEQQAVIVEDGQGNRYIFKKIPDASPMALANPTLTNIR